MRKVIFGAVLELFLFGVIATFAVIYKQTRNICGSAVAKYGPNCDNALLRTVSSPDESVLTKNHAVWALGQLANKESLPVLYRLRDTVPQNSNCDQKSICTYELAKAIKWCEKGNMTSWMYKNRNTWKN